MRITLESSDPRTFYPLQINIGSNSAGDLSVRDQVLASGFDRASIRAGSGTTGNASTRGREDLSTTLGGVEGGLRFHRDVRSGAGGLINIGRSIQ